MNTTIIEKVLDVVCEELTKKWYGYDTNTIFRDDFIDSVMSYENIVSKKYLEYLYIHTNIETECDKNPVCEFYSDSIEIVSEEMKKYNDNYIIDEIIDLKNNKYGFIVYELTNTIKEITCDYSYLSNIEYSDVFGE